MMPDTIRRSVWPITVDDITAARDRIRAYVPVSPLRSYPVLDEAVGHDIRVMVKHENFNPTNSFKVRNTFSLITSLSVNVVCSIQPREEKLGKPPASPPPPRPCATCWRRLHLGHAR